jgi:hypothetical protein
VAGPGRGWWPRPASLARDAGVGLVSSPRSRCRPSPPSKLRAGLPEPEPQPSVRPPVPSPNPIQVPASPTARFRFRLFFLLFFCPADGTSCLLASCAHRTTASVSACVRAAPSRSPLHVGWVCRRLPRRGGKCRFLVSRERIYDGFIHVIDLQCSSMRFLLIMACKLQQLDYPFNHYYSGGRVRRWSPWVSIPTPKCSMPLLDSVSRTGPHLPVFGRIQSPREVQRPRPRPPGRHATDSARGRAWESVGASLDVHRIGSHWQRART